MPPFQKDERFGLALSTVDRNAVPPSLKYWMSALSSVSIIPSLRALSSMPLFPYSRHPEIATPAPKIGGDPHRGIAYPDSLNPFAFYADSARTSATRTFIFLLQEMK